MLVLITVVALAPVGIGFGVAQLAVKPRPGATRQELRRPPSATVEAGGASVPAVLRSYCWTYRGHRGCRQLARRSGTARALVVHPGQQVRVSFATPGAPRSARLELGGGGVVPPQAASRSAPGNPAIFRISGPPGRRAAVVVTTWGQGRADYALTLEVG